MWLMSQRNPCEMQQCCQCTFLKHFSITKHILAKKKFFIIAIFLKWRFLFYLVNQRMKKICFYCSRGFVCCLGKNLWSQIWWGTSKAFIWDQLHWSEMVLRCSRGKKWIKNGPKLDKKCSKTVTWSFIDTFWTYFWWILLRNNTSFHLRLITLICDHFDEFCKQKTDQKGLRSHQNQSKITQNWRFLTTYTPDMVIIWPHMACLPMFLSHITCINHILPYMG